GGLLGGMIAGHMSGRLSPARLFELSLGLVGATIAIAANVPILPLIFPLVALVGIPVVGWLVGAQTVLQDSVADRYRGSILGTYSNDQRANATGRDGFGGRVGRPPRGRARARRLGWSTYHRRRLCAHPTARCTLGAHAG